MRSNRLRILWAAALAFLGTACGGFVDGTGETGYRNIGVNGGDVRARDTVVSVPAGAVGQPITITIAPAPAEELPEGAAGRAVDVGPADVQFNVPVTVELRFDGAALPDATRLDLVWIGAVVDGEWEPLMDPVLDEAARIARGTTRRSGRFGVVHGCGRGRRCPTALSFASAPQRVEAGRCSAPAELSTVDAAGRISPVQHDTTVALSADEASVSFYADAACQRQISSLVIPARGTSGTFHFRGQAARSVTLTATARDLHAAIQHQTIYPGPGTRFGFVTPPQTVQGGTCSAVNTVAFEDSEGNRSPVPQDARVVLTSSTTPNMAVTFFADDQCLTAASGVTVPAGSATASFWFQATAVPAAVTVTLVATAGAFGSSFTATQHATVAPPAAVSLRFFSAAQTVAVGTCSAPVMVGAVDAAGNRSPVAADTAVDLVAPTPLPLYSDASCFTPVRVVTIPSGGISASFHFKGLSAGTYPVTATASGLGSASQDQLIR